MIARDLTDEQFRAEMLDLSERRNKAESATLRAELDALFCLQQLRIESAMREGETK